MGAAVLTIVGSTAFVSTSAMAQTSTDNHASMITSLAQKLGISEDKVKTAFDQMHTERESEMTQMMNQKLTDLVTAGKLTEAQKQAIIAKMAELKAQKQSEMQNMQNLTPEQRKASMDAKKTELENWAKSQGIDLSLIPFGKGMMGGHHGFGHGMMGQQPTDGQ